MVFLSLFHLFARNGADAINSPRFNVTRCESCIVSVSSSAAIISMSSHHFSFSGSSHSQWLTILRLTHIESFIASGFYLGKNVSELLVIFFARISVMNRSTPFLST